MGRLFLSPVFKTDLVQVVINPFISEQLGVFPLFGDPALFSRVLAGLDAGQNAE